MICPPSSVPGHDRLEGCSSDNVVGPDGEGLYDCLDCGLWMVRERHQCDPGDTVCMVCAWMPVRPTATRPAPPAS